MKALRKGDNLKGRAEKCMKRKLGKMLSLLLVVTLSMVLFAPCAAAVSAAKRAESSTDGVKIGAEVLLESETWKEYLKGKMWPW